MMSALAKSVVFTAIIATFSGCLSGALAGEITLGGDVPNPQTFSLSNLAAFPRSGIEALDDNGVIVTYTGVDVSYLLKMSGAPVKEELKGPSANKYLVARGRDGFSAVISLPELDRARFLVADSINGKPLSPYDGPLRIISPDDKRRLRWVKQVERLDIQTADY